MKGRFRVPCGGFEGLKETLTYQFELHFIHNDGEVTVA